NAVTLHFTIEDNMHAHEGGNIDAQLLRLPHTSEEFLLSSQVEPQRYGHAEIRTPKPRDEFFQPMHSRVLGYTRQILESKISLGRVPLRSLGHPDRLKSQAVPYMTRQVTRRRGLLTAIGEQVRPVLCSPLFLKDAQPTLAAAIVDPSQGVQSVVSFASGVFLPSHALVVRRCGLQLANWDLKGVDYTARQAQPRPLHTFNRLHS